MNLEGLSSNYRSPVNNDHWRWPQTPWGASRGAAVLPRSATLFTPCPSLDGTLLLLWGRRRQGVRVTGTCGVS